LVKDEAQLQAINLLQIAKTRELVRVPVESQPSRTKNNIVKRQVLSELTGVDSPRRIRTHRPQSPSKPSVFVAEIRANQPSSPMSPKTKSKAVGVHIGFQLNIIMTILKRAVDEHHGLSQRIFLRTLRSKNNRLKSINKLTDFIGKKIMNSRYHAMHDIVEYAFTSSVSGDQTSIIAQDIDSPTKRIVPTILPLGETHPLFKIPPHVYDIGHSLNKFASVGRITGVLLSIIRIQKLAFLNELKKQNLSKLYFLQRM